MHREVVPPLERRLEHLKEWTGITGVQCAKGRAPRSADVQALPGRRGEGASAIVPLFGDEAEELTLGIGLRLQRRAILRHRQEALGEERDDIGIAECQPTGGDTVVSSAAEGVSVHRPQEDWPADLEGQASRLPKVGLPRDRLPLEFIGMRLDGGNDVAERGRRPSQSPRSFNTLRCGRQGSCLRSDFVAHDIG